MGCAAINCGYTEDSHKERRDSNEGRIVPREPDGSSRAQGWYVVCEYTPAGNVIGDDNEFFKKNVRPMEKSSSAASSKSQRTSGAVRGMSDINLWAALMAVALGVVAIEMSLYS